MRYKPVENKPKKNISMSTNLNNLGEINSTKLNENGNSVLTNLNVAKNHLDSSNKLVSLELMNKILENYNPDSLNNNVFINDKNTLEKERNEINAKIDVLLDLNITPEMVFSKTKYLLIEKLNMYETAYKNLILYLDKILNSEKPSEIIDIEYLNYLLENYKQTIADTNKFIQITTQEIMTIKTEKAIKIASENTNLAIAKFGYSMIIFSSNGPFFKKGYIDTALTAKVFKDNIDITENYSDLQFKWTRESQNKASDESWNIGSPNSKTIKILNKDYQTGGCSFICSLYDEKGIMIVNSLR